MTENTNTAVQNEQQVQAGTASAVTTQEEKTLTQSEVDQIVEARLARERRNQPSADELKAFRAWKAQQQTEAERAAQREQDLAAKTQEAENLRRELVAIKKGVNHDVVDFVLFKVGKQDGDFEKNLDRFLSENPRYAAKDNAFVTFSTGPSLSGGARQNTTNDIMNNIIRKRM